MVGFIKNLLNKNEIMKKNIFFICILIAGLSFSSCKKTLDSENVSTGMANYPNIIMNGDQYITILVGQTYTDKGATASSGVTDITSTMTTEGSVNVNTPGVYMITYSVTNDEQRSLSTTRYVGVITPAAAAMDISGTYVRVLDNNPARVNNVVKKDYPGLYTIDNPGGTRNNVEGDAPYFVTIYMWQTDAGIVVVPPQSTALGTFAVTSGTYTAATQRLAWKVSNQYFGTGVRTFAKQ